VVVHFLLFHSPLRNISDVCLLDTSAMECASELEKQNAEYQKLSVCPMQKGCEIPLMPAIAAALREG